MDTEPVAVDPQADLEAVHNGSDAGSGQGSGNGATGAVAQIPGGIQLAVGPDGDINPNKGRWWGHQVVLDDDTLRRSRERRKDLNDEVAEYVSPYGDKHNYVMAGFICLLYTSPSPRDQRGSRMPSSA